GDVGLHSVQVNALQSGTGSQVLHSWGLQVHGSMLLTEGIISAASGGSLSTTQMSPDGAVSMTLTIPPGALASDTVVGVYAPDSTFPDEDAYQAFVLEHLGVPPSDANPFLRFQLSPSGQTFSHPVEVSITLPVAVVGTARPDVRHLLQDRD